MGIAVDRSHDVFSRAYNGKNRQVWRLQQRRHRVGLDGKIRGGIYCLRHRMEPLADPSVFLRTDYPPNLYRSQTARQWLETVFPREENRLVTNKTKSEPGGSLF